MAGEEATTGHDQVAPDHKPAALAEADDAQGRPDEDEGAQAFPADAAAEAAFDDEIEVSFVVAVYNARDTLKQALDSLCSQTLKAIEIIVVDDASTDSSRARIRQAMEHDSRISAISHGRNRGYGASMNDGLALARGRWVGILEPDDWVLPDMAQALVEAAHASAADGQVPDVVKAPYYRITGTLDDPTFDECAYRNRVEPVGTCAPLGPDNIQLMRQHPSIWSALYAKSFIEDNGIRFPEHPGAGWADNEFFYRTLLSARAILYVDEPFYCYREDSPEQEREFVQAHPTLPLTRWLELDQIAQQLAAGNDCVQAAHVLRGFDYLASCIEAGVADLPEVAALKARMYDAMDPQVVMGEEAIDPGLKRDFAAHRGIDFDEAQAARMFKRYRRSEGMHMLRTNGVGFTLKHLRRYLTGD